MEILGFFSMIPQFEIIRSIFLFCDVPSQINFSLSCKTFLRLGTEDYWKEKSRQLWTFFEMPTKAIEDVFPFIPHLTWRLIALHLSNDTEIGRSRVLQFEWDKDLVIGYFSENSKLVGNWLQVSEDGLFGFGDWMKNGQGKGMSRTTSGDLFIGEFNFYGLHGEGQLIDFRGAIYVGQFLFNRRNGKGTITFPDGFSFTANWKVDRLEDPVNHPEVQECINKKKCTRSKEYPQILYNVSTTRSFVLCQSCFQNSNHQISVHAVPLWSYGICECQDLKCLS
eukprot:TRINITY_DN14927_c0_g1_i1.p1 TRINITY_DN14927_c0_g1~~TRINITY_DN14927_c0_g1_i1.p1  ORF type:complete len:280 (-),score=42.03 TRINITY_DN14927_c0_g1_i1:70-909(-)